MKTKKLGVLTVWLLGCATLFVAHARAAEVIYYDDNGNPSYKYVNGQFIKIDSSTNTFTAEIEEENDDIDNEESSSSILSSNTIDLHPDLTNWKVTQMSIELEQKFTKLINIDFSRKDKGTRKDLKRLRDKVHTARDKFMKAKDEFGQKTGSADPQVVMELNEIKAQLIKQHEKFEKNLKKFYDKL